MTEVLPIICGDGRAVTINAVKMIGGPAAADLAARVRGMAAWNLTRSEQGQIARARRNGAGLRLTFHDGSAAFIPKGTTAVHVLTV